MAVKVYRLALSSVRTWVRFAVFIQLSLVLSVLYYFSVVPYIDQAQQIQTLFKYNSMDHDSYNTSQSGGYLVFSPSCRIPDIDPWQDSIRHLIKNTQPINCSTRPALTAVRTYKLVLLRHRLKLYGPEVSCCYQLITRGRTPKKGERVDNQYSLSSCEKLEDSVNLRPDEEFILVRCHVPGKNKDQEIYVNFHARSVVRPDIKLKLQRNSTPGEKRMSVLMVGIDSVSRLNFIRHFPKTVNHLKTTGWVEMRGYNKMDDNTFPNVMAFLTGLGRSEVENKCMETTRVPLDNCPIIWKNFSEAGYITAYGEDVPAISTFNYMKGGFLKPPTDYYLRPFMVAAKKISNSLGENSACMGHSLTIDYIYQYALDFSKTFRDHLFFALFWMNSLSHDYFNPPIDYDIKTLTFLQDLSQNGVLNKTLVILLSDHGMRYGRIRETYIGWLEERLPFIFLWVPQWFRSLYPTKYSNLLENQNRLTSPYDLHLTLQDVLHGQHQDGTLSYPKCRSMFDELPWDRSCEDVGVTEHWCTCSGQRNLSVEGTMVRSMADFVVEEVNRLLEPVKRMQKKKNCARLSLKRVISIRTIVIKREQNFDEYVIVFETSPGHALFEATVSKSSEFKLLGSVSRINEFRSQGKCVNDTFLEKYCFCVPGE